MVNFAALRKQSSFISSFLCRAPGSQPGALLFLIAVVFSQAFSPQAPDMATATIPQRLPIAVWHHLTGGDRGTDGTGARLASTVEHAALDFLRCRDE